MLTGLSYANRLSEQIAVGATVTQRDVEQRGGAWAEEALTLTVDLTWELGSRTGGLKPFFGVGAGTTWLDEASNSSTTAMTATAQGGLRFAISEDIELVVAMRHFRIFDVNIPVVGEADIRGWESYLGLRLKF